MDDKIILKYVIIRIVCIIIIYMLGVLITPFVPNVKIVRVVEWIILLLITGLSFYIIGRYQNKAMKK